MMVKKFNCSLAAVFGMTASMVALSATAIAQQTSTRCLPPATDLGGETNSHTRFLESNLLPAVVQPGTKPSTLAERMAAYNVPGISVAVVTNGKLDWATGWGVRDVDSCKPVTPDTAFQAASISKAVTAVVALRLAERGKINLDENVNRLLRSWQLPVDVALAPKGANVRQLLSHTAGLGVHGFAGYASGSRLPTLIQILEGVIPANSAAVRSVLPAGRQWQYSGGGFVVAQLALEDATGTPFTELARREVLRPLGMKRSEYAQPASKEILANAAFGHSDGAVIAGGYHIYPELAPAGLWTTAGDLARFLIDVQGAAKGRKGHRLSPSTAREMLTPIKGNWGLGPALYGAHGNRRFGHDGANEGFQSTMVAYVEKGDGIVVLTNGDQGKRLADDIVRAVAADYGWTELASAPIIEAKLSVEVIAKVAGLYEGSGLSVFLDARDDGLFAQTGGPRPERLIAITANRFRTDASGILIEFAPNFESFSIIERGPPITLTKKVTSAVAIAEVPIYIRGSMNEWSTSAPLVRQSQEAYWAELVLQPGEY
jgi:CubicO group peptidase (beta-lactamase class C family)